MSSIGLVTMGKFDGPPSRVAVFSRSGGDAVGPYFEKKKPILNVTRVKYDKKNRKDINIDVSVKKKNNNEN